MKYSVLLRLHRWLLVITSLPVLLVCLSGASLSFSDEIDHALSPHLRNVPPLFKQTQGQLKATFDTVLLKVQDKTRYLQAVFPPQTPFDSLRVDVLKPDGQRWQQFYNPYSGQFLGERVYLTALPILLKRIHTQLLLGQAGAVWIKWTIPLFSVAWLVGLMLLWQRNRSSSKPFWQWPATWHEKLGSMSLPVLGGILITANMVLWTVFTFGTLQQVSNVQAKMSLSATTLTSLSKLCHPPQQAVAILAKANQRIEVICQSSQDYGSLTQQHWLGNVTLGFKPMPQQVIEDWLWGIHSGQILGLPGRMIWMWVSLIPLFLAWTGWVAWRRHSKRFKKV